VIAVGPGARDKKGNVIPTQVKAGDRVLLPGWGGNSIKVGEEVSPHFNIFSVEASFCCSRNISSLKIPKFSPRSRSRYPSHLPRVRWNVIVRLVHQKFIYLVSCLISLFLCCQPPCHSQHCSFAPPTPSHFLLHFTQCISTHMIMQYTFTSYSGVPRALLPNSDTCFQRFHSF